jgi:hypothetical protein
LEITGEIPWGGFLKFLRPTDPLAFVEVNSPGSRDILRRNGFLGYVKMRPAVFFIGSPFYAQAIFRVRFSSS